MRFSIILASRQRLRLLTGLLDSLIQTSTHPQEIEILTVFDIDDKESVAAIETLTEKYKIINAKFFTRSRSEWMHRDYINWIYPVSTGKYLMILNDDAKFTNKGWDEKSWGKIETYLEDKPDGVVYGFTENMTKNPRLCYFPLISRKAADILGFLLPNERKSWCADHDVYTIYTHHLVNRKLNLPDIRIEHISYHTGSRARDAVSFRVEEIFTKQKTVSIPIASYADRLSSYMANGAMKPKERKVLVVYNICGISKRENVSYYFAAITSILNQKFDSFHLVISSCASTPETRKIISDKLGSQISYNWIDDILPLSVTFNHTVRKCVQSLGKFESYLYVDSGVTFGSNRYVIRDLYELLKSGDYGMASAQVDLDDGFGYWGVSIQKGKDYTVPMGKTINLHCQLFSHELYKNYNNKILPDIFAHHTSESVFTFIKAPRSHCLNFPGIFVFPTWNNLYSWII